MNGPEPSSSPGTYTSPDVPGSIASGMHGRVCVITGATRGIGLETARGLAARRAEVVVVGRDERRLEDTLQELRRESGNDAVHAIRMDLASMNSIRHGAAEIVRRWPTIHVLVNNAGINARRRTASPDGRELTLAVNHLAPFLLTSLLAPALMRGAPSRVVNITSVFAHMGRVDLDDLDLGRRGYDATRAYTQSKVGLVMFTIELAERLRGTGVTANCVSPGLVATDLMRDHWYMTSPRLRPLWERVLLSPETAAERVIRVATSPALETVSGWILGADDKPGRVPRAARDPDRRQRLWELSALMTAAPRISTRSGYR